MSRDVSTSRAAANALGARNAIAFDCVHPLDECLRRLVDMGRSRAPPPIPDVDPEFTPPVPRVLATAENVRIEWHAVRFEGRWVRVAQRTRLEGTMVSNDNGRALFIFFLTVAVFSVFVMGFTLESTGLWFLVVPALLVVVGLPLLVSALGSARVASEIELVRFIGQAIGDPGKYAVRWRRWRDD